MTLPVVQEGARQDGAFSAPVTEGASGNAAAVNSEGGGVGFRLWDVTVTGYGSAIFEAQTRGKALSAAWRCDAFGHIDFKRFMSMARARVRRDPPPSDGYSYVRERYGMDPRMGQRARLSEGEGSTYGGREGVVCWGGPARHNHIRILIDGMTEPLNVHPSNVILLPSSESETAPPAVSTAPASDSPSLELSGVSRAEPIPDSEVNR